MMSGIRGKDTKPEITVRSMLFAAGLRYRLHRKDLPGTPDIVLPRRKVAIFVNGCFWHQHENCRLAKMPATNRESWKVKLERNKQRDQESVSALLEAGWRVLIVWECAVRDSHSREALAGRLLEWLDGPEMSGEIGEETSLSHGRDPET